MHVVDDLLAHVDRGAVVLERLLDGDHRPVDAGAVSAGRRQQHALLRRPPGGRAGARVPRGILGGSRDTPSAPFVIPPTLRFYGPGAWHRPGSPDPGYAGGDDRRTSAPPRATGDVPSTPDAPWPVAVLAGKLKGYIDRLGTVWAEGEITQWGVSGGNVYGKLKDLEQDVTVSFTIWSSTRAKLNEEFKQGDRVIALLKPNYWPKGGTLSMQVYELRHVGLGDLLERLERLRRQLAEEGLFALDRKVPLPFLPRCIGLITGKDSDAEKDVLRNAQLRWPSVQFRVRHTAVQGDRAARRGVRRDPRARRRPRGRRHHRRPRRRRLPEPAGLQRRDPRAHRRRVRDPARERDRARERPAAARRGRRPARLDARRMPPSGWCRMSPTSSPACSRRADGSRCG